MFGADSQASPIKNDDFAALFERTSTVGGKLTTGSLIKVEILSIGQEEVFVSTGTPVDGVIPKRDFAGKDIKVGQIVEARVIRVSDEQVLLRPQGARTSGEVDSLEDAFEMELPVEGTVTEVVKGGFRVKVNGIAGFCPMGQIDSRSVKDPQVFVGKKLDFHITQLALPRQLVVSRRKILEQLKAENEGEFLNQFKAGDYVDGTVTRAEPFGVFVELKPGLEGLVHISELSWERVRNPLDAVGIDQKVNVRILKIEDEDARLKISLSLKQGRGQLDPWSNIFETYPTGRVVEGTVEKRESFGLFVNLGPGVTGLLPKSKFKDSQGVESKRPGDKIIVQIAEIKAEERKLSLGFPGELGEEMDWKSMVSDKKLGTMADLFKNIKK